jgi:zinc transporter, ZIP family
MEARTAVQGARIRRVPGWLLGIAPLLLIVVAVGTFVALGAPGLGERNGPPVEELAVERTILRPGEIELVVRNDGPDPVTVSQVMVNDAFANFAADHREAGRLGSETIKVVYPWIEGQAYDVALMTATGATIDHQIPVAAETPDADAGFFGLMALLGLYVGVIPVALGMLWMPALRRAGPAVVRLLMAVTVGLLGFLAIDAALEGIETASDGPQVFGGAALVVLGAAVAYLTLAGIDAWLRSRRDASRSAGVPAGRLALLVAVGIGLHNLGEGLAIGSAYAIGALALGAFLVVGFAIHNTTEGLAIVAPLSKDGGSGLRRLVGLGLLAGAPAIVGAWIGAAAFHPALAALLLGVGVGAIMQVIQQLWPSLNDREGRPLNPLSVGGIVTGIALMYATGLMVSL